MDSGTFGGRILDIGDSAISPSSTRKRKSCWSARYRLLAVAGFHRASWSSMNASTCSRRIASTRVGIPRSLRNRRSPSQASV